MVVLGHGTVMVAWVLMELVVVMDTKHEIMTTITKRNR
jgi:hypothetical protein